MDLWDFPALSQAETPEEAVPEIAKLRQPDRSWMKERPLACPLEDWTIDPSRRRYTVTVEGVPFECLYLPGKGKKLYVMLSAGGFPPARNYPVFSRWTYHGYLNGHLLCVDDPMYFFHRDTFQALWYYGTKDVSYLALLAKIIQKAMRLLSVKAENVVHIGNSGGGYAALYLCNMLNRSSAIAVNPQFNIKLWQYPRLYEYFLDFGVDLDAEDPLHRNRIRLNNKTCRFFICVGQSNHDYQAQFQPFAKEHGIPVRYGISQHENYMTWLYESKWHTVGPEKIDIVLINYLLQKARNGENINELWPASLALCEILNEEHTLKINLKNAEAEKQVYRANFFSLISQIVLEEWGKLINCKEYPPFCRVQAVRLYQEGVQDWINYFTDFRRDAYYQILCHKGIVFFRFLRRLSVLGAKKQVWLENASQCGVLYKESYHYDWHVENVDFFAMSTLLDSKNQRQDIRSFILRTMDLWRDE